MLEEGVPRRYFYARLAAGLDRLIDKKFKESVEVWPADKPIVFTNGETVMPDDLEEWWKDKMANDGIRILAPGEKPEVMKRPVNISRTMKRIKFCPECGKQFNIHVGDEIVREDDCGGFMMNAIDPTGDVVFEYVLNAETA